MNFNIAMETWIRVYVIPFSFIIVGVLIWNMSRKRKQKEDKK